MSIKSEPAIIKNDMLDRIIGIIALMMSLFHLYNGAFGTLQSYFLRIVHLLFVALLVFFMSYRKRTNRDKDIKSRLIDLSWIVISIAVTGYLIVNYDYLTAERFMFVTPLTAIQKISGILTVLLVLEATRRRVGLILPMVAVVFLLYVFVGPYLPGILYHKGFSLDKLLDVLYLTPEGIFGAPLGICASLLVLFIIFGAFLEQTGFGSFLTEFSMAIAGWSRGGPAKVAVIASALMGMISGSSNANVVTTGAFTIPLMKKVGYTPEFAGAVEAAASTGGQMMPPIMGAAIFLMVEYTGIPYIVIAKYALLPSLLYFLSVGLMVHLEALKTGLKGIPREQLPDWKLALKSGGHLIIPIVFLVAMLIKGYSTGYAGFCSIIAMIIVSMFKKSTRLNIRQIITALEKGAHNTVTVAVSCATAGIIIGSVALTGLGVRFTASLLDLSGGIMFVALVFSMFAAIILGMGLPTTAAYILMIAMVVPSLIKMGIPDYAAHLFAVYYSCVSLITPPVAITSYAAAGLAGGDMMKTSWAAMRLGLSAYIVPFMFVYGPALLLVGTVGEVVLSTVSAILGIVALSAGLQRYLIRKSTFIETLLLVISALLLIKPGLATDLVGFSLMAIVCFMQIKLYPNTMQIRS